MPNPKTIQLFLMDGKANGRVKCTLANWTGVAYAIPRTDLALCKDRQELNQTGVYLLFGKDDDSGEDRVYIGQARARKNGNGVLGRIREHIGEERLEYWTHAIILITSNDTFGPTEISYLENLFCNWAVEAGRTKVTNGNDPSAGRVTEEKEAELLEFASYAKLVIGALGYKVFEPIDEAKSPEPPSTMPEPVLHMTYRDARATGRQTSDGFVVLAGSTLVRDRTKSCPPTAVKNREAFADRINPDMMLTTDVLVTSPSAAATFIAGSSVSGTEYWHTEDGTKLRDLEVQELDQ